MSRRSLAFTLIATLLVSSCAPPPPQPVQATEPQRVFFDTSKMGGGIEPCLDAARVMLKAMPSVTVQCAANTKLSGSDLSVHDIFCDPVGCHFVGDPYTMRRTVETFAP